MLAYYLANFCQKLHENEELLGSGGRVSKYQVAKVSPGGSHLAPRSSSLPMASWERAGGEHDPIAYDSFNIHENDPKIKPDVLVSKQHVLRVSPTTLKNLAGQFLDGIDYCSINFIKQIEIYMNFT